MMGLAIIVVTSLSFCLQDCQGEEVSFLKDVKSILLELKTSDKWKESQVAVASTCNEPSWAHECIEKFSVGKGILLKDVFGHKEIHYGNDFLTRLLSNGYDIEKLFSFVGNKADHLRSISKATGVALTDMIFFDDRMHNCRSVAGVGVTVLYTPHGITREAFEYAIDKFPQPGTILEH